MFNAVNAAIFPVQRRYRHHFPSSTPIALLFFQFNAVNAAIFGVHFR